VQIDHTPIDLIVVDPIERNPIGRPWITVAIDVFSRCIAGFHVTLEAPSSTSVGLCLTHVAADKRSWLEGVGVEADWPVAGRPRRIGVDNASEFHSEALERGCAQHGIAIEWRPRARLQAGGVVERVIGTLMALVHGLPGTTFSDALRRGT
jgi:putative transposase